MNGECGVFFKEYLFYVDNEILSYETLHFTINADMDL